jgi:DNA-binding response OmpR family regulator
VAAVDRDGRFVAALAAHAAATGLTFWRSEEPIEPTTVASMKLDAMVLDPGALGSGGWAYFEQLCKLMPELGLVVCTQRTTLDRRVRGLRLGADDWLTKPAHPEEAIARAEAILRSRCEGAGTEPVIQVGDLRLSPGERSAFVCGSILELSRQEFDLLLTFARTTGEVLDRQTLYRRAWGYEMVAGDRSVDVFVARLRAKLADRRRDHTYIHTHFRIGYRFDPGP